MRFPDRISYALVTEADINGDVGVSATVTNVPAKVDEDERIIRTGLDEEVVSSHLVALRTTLPKGTHVWLTADGTGERYEVQASKSARGLAGGRLCEVRLS